MARGRAIPARQYATRAAARVASMPDRCRRSRIELVSVADPSPAILTACGRAVRTTHAAPSQIGEQSLRNSGVATARFWVVSKYASSGSGRPWNAASGFSAPSAWARTMSRASRSATGLPRSRRSASHACVTSAISAGIVKPKLRSAGSIVFDMIAVATSVVTFFIRSPASTSTFSHCPDATLW